MEIWVATFTALNVLIHIILTYSYGDDVFCNTTTTVQNVCCNDRDWSCKNLCGYASKVVCSCHPSCVIFDKCCDDFQEFCPEHYNNVSLISSKLRDIETSCHPLFWYMVVSSCPNGTTDLEDQRRCTSNTPESFLDVIYITDSETGVEYKNIYCYRCNRASNTSYPEPNAFMFTLSTWPDFDNLNFSGLWQLITDSGAAMVLDRDLASNSIACIEKPQNSCSSCVCNVHDNPCQDDLASVVHISEDTTYRIYRNKHCTECKIEKSKITCDAGTHPKPLKYLTVNKFDYDTTQIYTMQFGSAGKYDWVYMDCNMDLSECRKICPETIPLINGSCNGDFQRIYVLIKVRAVSGDRNELQDLTIAERNATIQKIIATKYVFNASVPWRVLDRSEEAPLWSVCVELSSYYQLASSPFSKQVLKSSFTALVSDLTLTLKYASENRTLQICRELSYARISHPSVECSGTLTQVFVMSEKDARKSKAISQTQKQTQVMLYFTIVFVLYTFSD